MSVYSYSILNLSICLSFHVTFLQLTIFLIHVLCLYLVNLSTFYEHQCNWLWARYISIYTLWVDFSPILWLYTGQGLLHSVFRCCYGYNHAIQSAAMESCNVLDCRWNKVTAAGTTFQYKDFILAFILRTLSWMIHPFINEIFMTYHNIFVILAIVLERDLKAKVWIFQLSNYRTELEAWFYALCKLPYQQVIPYCN